MNLTINQILDEDFYLSQYPEVVNAIANGIVTTPLDHYLTIGQYEGYISAQLFSDVYVFGDSFSDDGNLFELTNGIFPEFANFEGRFTNGQIWIETLIPQLGLEINPENNFAYGGATTGAYNVLNPRTDVLPEELIPLPGIETQVDDFLVQNFVIDSNALYVLWGGGNDYVGLGLTETEVEQPINNILASIDKLADAGAKNILVPNVFDLGAIPLALDSPPEVQQRLATATLAHNQALQIALEEVEENSDLNIIPVDVYSALNQAIDNPNDLGFSNVTEAYLDTNAINPDEFIFWNPIHPTVRSHNLFANQAQKSLFNVSEVLSIAEANQGSSPQSVPEPSSLNSILAMIFALLFLQNFLAKKIS